MAALIKRPKPIPDVRTKPFWDAAQRRKLVIQRCSGCGKYYLPPVGMCPICLRYDLVYEQVSGKGTIYSFTLIHDTRIQGFEGIVPYPVVHVELAEQSGLILLGNMLKTDPDKLQIGAPVHVIFEEIEEGFLVPDFELD